METMISCVSRERPRDMGADAIFLSVDLKEPSICHRIASYEQHGVTLK